MARDRVAKSQAGEGLSESWVRALGKLFSHPARLSILLSVAQGDAASPTEAAERHGLSVGVAAYHMRTLASLGLVKVKATRPVRGAIEHFYEPTEAGKAAVHAFETAVQLAPRAYPIARGTAQRG